MTNKTIVVFGASRGIGKELVLQFANDESTTVIALSRNIEGMKKQFLAKNIHCAYADLSADDLHKTLADALAAVPSIDGLVFTAGKMVNKPFLSLTKAEIEACYATNAVGIMHATQYFVPKMMEKGGHIVQISTMGAYQGSVKFPGLAAYSSSKSGITTFTELFAEEFKETEIKMNCLCLGAVQTEMLEEAFPGYTAPVTAEEMAKYIADFTLNAHQFYNGKVLPVSSTTP